VLGCERSNLAVGATVSFRLTNVLDALDMTPSRIKVRRSSLTPTATSHEAFKLQRCCSTAGGERAWKQSRRPFFLMPRSLTW
jgi:hypothetical protein